MKPVLYNSAIPRDLAVTTEIIVDVYAQLQKMTWSNHSHEEIGFYERDKKTKSEIFFGIWYEAWEHFGCPLCLTIWDNGYAPIQTYLAIKKGFEAKKIAGVTFSIDFQGYAILVFDHTFFNWENDAERLADLFVDISNKAGINKEVKN